MIDSSLFLTPSQGAEVLEKGGVLVFPTETVYGLGALATNSIAFSRVYEIKKRPSDNPLILHYANLEDIARDAELTPISRNVMETFSPGPLTIILNKKNKALLPSTLDTVAVRIPKHASALELLSLLGKPVAAPSANLSGKPSITDSITAREVLGGLVDGFLEGAEPEIGMESTVIDFTSNRPVLLRFGSVSVLKLINFLPDLQVPFQFKSIGAAVDMATPKSPGTKYRHYAPKGKVRILENGEIVRLGEKEAYLGSQNLPNSNHLSYQKQVLTNKEYLYYLYRFLNECDRRNIQSILLEKPTPGEFSETVLDRIFKIESKEIPE